MNITFDAPGAREFEKLTEKNVGRRMAIVLDDNVHSAPRINEKIPGGRARITMGRAGGKSFDEWLSEAQTLALVLKAGALPAPVTIGEIRQVGASLGDELIKKGSLAALVGLALVVVFMAIYYEVRPHRGRGAGAQRPADPRRPGALQRHADAAGHRRLRADAGHRGGRERAHQRAHPRGAGARQDARARRWTRATTARSGPSSTRTSPR